VIEFRVLGSVEAVDHDGPCSLGAPRQKALLAALIVHRGQPVSTDRLIDALWGERPPATAVKIVQGYVSNLRKALGDGLLVTRGRGYELDSACYRLDVERFESLVEEGRRALGDGHARVAATRLREALGVWRGPPLADFAYEPFAQGEIARLDEARLGALEDRIDADLLLGDHLAVVGELEALTIEEPTRERFARQLMLALYRSERQADALDVYRRTRARLGEALGLEPGPELRALQSEILAQAPSLAGSAAASAPPSGGAQPSPARVWLQPGGAGLPALVTVTISRRHEIDEVTELLQRPAVRLVTLTGPGGVGKTRLALELAHALRPRYADGVCWVELAAVARSDDVGSSVARALALTPLPGETVDAALERHLAGRRLLLIMDNFEHLLKAAGWLARLLAESDRLTVLATSRERLSLAAEHQIVVRPLMVPARPDATTVDELESTAATALFLAAARRHDSRFTVSATDASVIAGVCSHLDGLPLAVELAAGATQMLTVNELASRLDEALTELVHGPRDAPARHQTLAATIQWSHDLLDAPQRAAFARFAVFAGGATLPAAQAITGATLTSLQALLAKSLLDRLHPTGDSARLVMLDTIRQYAGARLTADPEHQAIRRRHCAYYLDLVEENIPRLFTHREARALAVLDAEIHNLRSALQWALDAAPHTALRLAGQLGRYWRARFDREGLQWVDVALLAAGEHAPTVDRARARLHHAGQLSWRGQGQAAINGLTAALALFTEAGDHAGLSETLSSLALAVGVFGDDLEGERRYAQEACEHARIAGDDGLLGVALGRLAAPSSDERGALLEQAARLLAPLGNHGDIASVYAGAAYVAMSEDRLAEAARLLEIGLQAAERSNNPFETMVTHGNIGLVHLFSRDPERAHDAFTHQLRLCGQHSFRHEACEALAGLAAVAAAHGRDKLAAQLTSAAHSLGYATARFDKRIDERLDREYLAAARARYGDPEWRRAEQAGAALSLEQAIALALEQPCEPSTPPADTARHAR
jgi:predicted ATPase/DNA-binding SARP family transcriptional activator